MNDRGKTAFGTRLTSLADLDPDRAALTCLGITVSRRELVLRAQRLAVHLAELGVGRGSTVTIGLPNSIEFIEAMLATWWLGATPQAISHRLAPAERRAILELAEPAVAVGVPEDEAGPRPALSAAQVRLAADGDGGGLAELDPVISPVWKIMTSGGSTGRPKLIVADQPANVSDVTAFAPMLGLPTDGAVLVTGPMSHNAPFVVAITGLLTGNHIVVMPRFDAAETLRLVELHRIQWLYLVPTMMLRIWRLPEAERLDRDISSLEIAFHMAAPCPPWLKEAWIDWLGAEKIYELYGGTELQAMTLLTGTEWLAHRGSVGRTVIGEIEARDVTGTTLPPEAVGELWMRRGATEPSPYRYIGATARSAADGWETLGDIGYLDADGYVYVTDRDTDMIVVGGSNVYPAELEAALDEHPAVLSSCVVGLPHEDLGSAPHAIVELTAPVTDEELLAHMRERLAPYKVPRTIEVVDYRLRDDAGKVRRSALRAERMVKG